MEISCEFIMFSTNNLHSNCKLVFSSTIAAGLLLALQPLAAQVGLGLSPMRAEMHLAPGAAYTGVLRLVNEGAAVHVRSSLLDFHLDAEQTPQFEAEFAAESAYSCRQWLAVNPMETELDANGEKAMRYTLRVPVDAQPRSYHCAAGFTTMGPASDANGMGLRTAVRVVAAFYVIVGNPAVEGQLSEVAMEQVPGSKGLRAVVVLENSGKILFRPTGSVAVLDPDGKVLETYQMTPVPILPERKQRLLFPLKQVAEGQPYSIRVRVDVGTGEIQEGTVVVQAAKSSQ
jgi:hypothetical protein